MGVKREQIRRGELTGVGVIAGGLSCERKGGGAVMGGQTATMGAPDALYLYGGAKSDQGLQSSKLDSVAWIRGGEHVFWGAFKCGDGIVIIFCSFEARACRF